MQTVKNIIGVLLTGFSLFYCGYCGEAGYSGHNTIPELNASNTSFRGIGQGEIVRIQSGNGEEIDLGNSGQMYLAGTFIPVYSAANPEITASPEGKNCSLNLEQKQDGLNVWAIECIEIKYFSISVNVNGLDGNSLGLQLNNSETAFIQSNGIFTFSSKLAENSNYYLSIISMPQKPDQLCSISSPNGMITADNLISIDCASNVKYLSGTVRGQKTSFSLKNSHGEILTVPANTSSFSFSDFFPENAFYEIYVESQPMRQECYIINSSGKVKDNTGEIEVICSNSIEAETKINLDENLAETAEGKNLEIWFYSRPDQIVFPLFKKTFVYKKNKTYKYQMPAGQYHIRAFIDMNDNYLPEIGVDYQSRVFAFNNPLPGDVNFFELDLDDTSSDTRLSFFNASIINSQEWHQPAGGRCGGLYIRLESSGFYGSKAQLSSLYVLTPDMKTIELHDDGGCGDSYSNLSSSFDSLKNDHIYTAGINLTDAAAGRYIFYFLNYYTGKITIIYDNLDQIIPLSPLIYLIKPNGELPVTTKNPVLEWNPVSGAGSYEILIESTDHVLNNFTDPLRFVKNNFYQPPFDLPDNSAFRVSIQAFDRDITLNQTDFDLVSQGPDNFFITDFLGTNSITISGNLINNSENTGSYIIYADGNTEIDGWDSSVFLNSDSRTYSLSVLKNGKGQGAMISSLNIDQSGFILSSANQPYTIWRSFFLPDNDISIDLVWSIPLILLRPENFEQGTGSYPLFSWEQYNSLVKTTRSYILTLRPRNTTSNAVIIGLKDNYFDFRYTGIASYVNLSGFYACVINSAGADAAYCEIFPESRLAGGLDENTQWEWHITAVSCSLDGIKDPYDRTYLDNYKDCILNSFTKNMNITGESQKRIFSAY